MAATKVKFHDWGWNLLIFYQDSIGFQVKMVNPKLIMNNLFLITSQYTIQNGYSTIVSGALTCFPMVLSKRNLNFLKISRNFCYLGYDLTSETKYSKGIDNYRENHSQNTHKIQISAPEKVIFFRKIKIRFDSTIGKHVKAPETIVEYSFYMVY